jgi:cell division protein ZipA
MDWLRWILLLLGIVLIGGIYWSGQRRERERGEGLLARARRTVARGPPADGPDPSGPSEAAGPPTEEVPPEVDLDTGGGRPGDPAGDDIAPGPAAGGADKEPAPQATDARPGPRPEPEPSVTAPGAADAAAGPEAVTESAAEPREPPGPLETERHARPADAQAGAPAADPRDSERIVVLYVVAPKGERLVGAQIAEAFARHGLEHGALDIFHASDSEGRTVFSVANAVDPGTFDPSTMDTLSTPGLALFLGLPGPQSAETAFDRMVRTARALADELGARVLDGDHSTLTRQTEQHLRDELREFDHRRSRKRP